VKRAVRKPVGATPDPSAPELKGGDSDRIVRRTLSEQVVRRLRPQILSMAFPQGFRLLTENIARELGVSRTPVREGLRELAKEGLVTYDGRSYFVKEFSPREISEIISIRKALEELAIRQACSHITEAALASLRRICDETAREIQENNIEALVRLDISFHDLIADASMNERLRMLTGSLSEQFHLTHRLSFKPEQMQETLREHRDILKTLEQRDVGRAVAAMDYHLDQVELRTLPRGSGGRGL
jgi:DNA-binding GntR family transcriptional regulator